jgi:micrococcal nuclease
MKIRLAALATICAGLLITAPAFAADRDCADFTYQEDAQAYFISLGGPSQDPDRLDGDHDGQACEALPHRGSSPEPAQPPAPTDPAGDGVTAPPRKREVMRGAHITAVVDGDTIKVRLASGKRVTVRLIGVDTPEVNKPGVAVECGARQAAANMKRLAFKKHRGRGVTLTTDPSQDRTDKYGRLLAYARIDTGRDLSLEQIRAGWSRAYVYAVPFQRLRSYDAAEGAARTAMRGAWSACAGDFHSAQ